MYTKRDGGRLALPDRVVYVSLERLAESAGQRSRCGLRGAIGAPCGGRAFGVLNTTEGLGIELGRMFVVGRFSFGNGSPIGVLNR